MKTKAPKVGDSPKPEALFSAPANSSVVPDEKVNRISIPLTKDGQIEWDSMRGTTREKLKGIIASPETAKVIGSAAPVAAAIEVFDPMWCGSIFDAVGKIEVFTAVKLYKFSPEVAEAAFTYTQLEKEKLAGPTAKVINKYAPIWMEQFKDEIALAMLFVTITAMKFQMASMLQAQQNAKSNSRPATPIPVPEDDTEVVTASSLKN